MKLESMNECVFDIPLVYAKNVTNKAIFLIISDTRKSIFASKLLIKCHVQEICAFKVSGDVMSV